MTVGQAQLDPVRQRQLGAYYTPRDASTWMAEWLVDDGVRTILEPSSGDGSFVHAVAEVADAEGIDVELHAVEIDSGALISLGGGSRIHKIHSDFHLVDPFPVDAAIGNPPFVRFRHVNEEDRSRAIRAGSRALGTKVDTSGSIWMTIVLHAATFLRPGGRLAFVLPADALYVKYAQPFWRFMSGRFGHLRVVRCRERIFPTILQDVVLLLADRSGGCTAAIESELFATLEDLTASRSPQRSVVEVNALLNGDKPFARALLGEHFGEALRAFEEQTVRVDSYAKFNIGYVDANKPYYHPTTEVQKQYGLPKRSLPLAVKSGRSMTGSGLYTSSLSDAAVQRLWLPNPEELTEGERNYITAGESRDAHLGFKARHRKPWYVVPDVRVPDLLMPVFGELPKIMVNDAGLVASNSLMLGFWREPVDAGRFVLAWYSSVTRLGIELSVHSLGGGVLVVVPLEADAIRMPSLPEEPASEDLLVDLEEALRASDLPRAYQVGDRYLLRSGWRRADLNAVREMADMLLKWRVDR